MRLSLSNILRWLAILLMLTGSLAGVQATVYLEIGHNYVTGSTTLNSSNSKNTIKSGTVTFNASTMTLTLSNVNYQGIESFIINREAPGLTIELVGSNVILDGSAWEFMKSTTIQGSGSLKTTKNIIISGQGTKLTLSGSASYEMTGTTTLKGASSSLKVASSKSVVLGAISVSSTATNAEVAFSGTGNCTVKPNSVSRTLEFNAEGARLTIGDGTRIDMQGSVVGYADKQVFEIRKTSDLTFSSSGSFTAFGKGCEISFTNTTASLKASLYGFEKVTFDNCDFATDYVYYYPDIKKVMYKSKDLGSGMAVKIKPVTTKYGIYFGDRELNDVNCRAFYAPDMGGDGTISYNPTTNVLTMKDVYMNWYGGKSQYPAFDNYKMSNLTINLYGRNEFRSTNTKYATFRIRGKTTLRTPDSTGKLVVTNRDGGEDIRVENSATLTVGDGTVVESGAISSDGKSALTVDYATVSLKGHKEGTIRMLTALTLNRVFIEKPDDAYYDTTKRKLLAADKTVVTGAAKIVPGAGKGDVNQDGLIDKNDYRDLIGYLFTRKEGIWMIDADVNRDGYVNVADIIWLLNKLSK